MIRFPATLTPVPFRPGYFWDVDSHKLYSIKIGGVLRELKVQRLHPCAQAGRFAKIKTGELYYALSQQGYRRSISVKELKKLALVDYAMPVIDYGVKEVV
tara:strand:+ start:976 stop:1275 length:300 start_codon:yes stop_codon:yes gene_type:complete